MLAVRGPAAATAPVALQPARPPRTPQAHPHGRLVSQPQPAPAPARTQPMTADTLTMGSGMAGQRPSSPGSSMPSATPSSTGTPSQKAPSARRRRLQRGRVQWRRRVRRRAVDGAQQSRPWGVVTPGGGCAGPLALAPERQSAGAPTNRRRHGCSSSLAALAHLLGGPCIDMSTTCCSKSSPEGEGLVFCPCLVRGLAPSCCSPSSGSELMVTTGWSSKCAAPAGAARRPLPACARKVVAGRRRAGTC